MLYCIIVVSMCAWSCSLDQPPEETDYKTDEIDLRGVWKPVWVCSNGREESEEEYKDIRFSFDQDTAVFYLGQVKVNEGEFRCGKSSTIRTIDIAFPRRRSVSQTLRGVYQARGGALIIAYSRVGDRPASFLSEPGSGVTLVELRRIGP
jgi:uncharacterized protein (TIGR03067 family)